MKLILRFFLLGLGVLILLVVAAGVFLDYKLADLKQEVIASVEKSLGAKIEVRSVSLDVRNQRLVALGLVLTNQRPSAPWDKAEMGSASARFHWHDLLKSTIPLTIDISSWNAVLRSPASVVSIDSEDGAGEAGKSSGTLFQVTQISATDGEVEVDLSGDDKVLIHRVAFTSNMDAGDSWTTRLKVGSVGAGMLETGQGTLQIKGDKDQVSFSNLHLLCEPGSIEGSGQISLGSNHGVQISLKAAQIPVAMLLATQWQMKLSGLATGNLDYQANDQGAASHGHIELAKGRFDLLLFLSKVTTLLDLPDLSAVDLDQATADFDWKDHVLQLSHLDLRKTDTVRVVGDVKVDPSGLVDGQLKLGLPTATLAKWPSLQEKVFPVALEDYSWAEVHLTGTPSHLEEDLTPRLLAAGAQQSGTMLNDAVKKAGDLLDDYLHK